MKTLQRCTMTNHRHQTGQYVNPYQQKGPTHIQSLLPLLSRISQINAPYPRSTGEMAIIDVSPEILLLLSIFREVSIQMLDHMLDLNYKKYKLHTTKLQNTVQ